MRAEQNNYAFIDSQNVNLAIREQGWKLDFAKFRIYLKDKYKISKAYLFIGYVANYQTLYDYLERNDYILIFKPTIPGENGMIKGNTDAEMVLYSMIEYNNYNRALIVTGDGDFYCLVHYLQEQEKLQKLLIPNSRKYSGLLKSIGNDKLDFMNNLKKLLQNQKNAD